MYPEYAQVIVDISNSNVDKIFEYGIPEDYVDAVKIGMRVIVPFGGIKSQQGFIISIHNSPSIEEKRIKPIKSIIDNYSVILPELIKLALWMKDKYYCTIVDALRVLIPSELRNNTVKIKNKRIISFTVQNKDYNRIYDSIRKNATKQREMIEFLKEHNVIDVNDLNNIYPNSSKILNMFESKGWISIKSEEVFREPYKSMKPTEDLRPELTESQKEAVCLINSAIDKNSGKILIHGVTGSGKTEVYLNSIEYAVSKGRSAIVLVPEISLTPQMVDRFRKRFGNDIAVLHSMLSAGEKYDEWRRIRFGEVKVVIGARSAVFAPLKNLGLIIIDEEHETTYRSENNPKYDASEVAEYRCLLSGAVVVKGSATPSIESYYKCSNSDYKLIKMPNRVNGQKMPEIDIVDMREELVKGNRSIFSYKLFQQMKDNIEAGNQIILFLNRRGYASFVSCRECGYVVKCKHCDVSMTYHQKENILQCHYCGYRQKVPQVCPNCGSRYIKYFGIGTQRVEEEVKKYFPNVSVIRMDNDTTRTKDSHYRLYKMFCDKKAQVLIGTQMIAKGLDFPDVTVVGVIAADTSLHIPDYRSSEKTFQLITQVAGRAGRADKKGTVIVQTYSPSHYSIDYAVKYDYEGFYKLEMENRYKSQFPPFSTIVRIIASGKDDKSTKTFIDRLYSRICSIIGKDKIYDSYILFSSESQAPVAMIKGLFRWQIFIKIKNGLLKDKILGDIENIVQSTEENGIFSYMDLNPLNMI